VSSPIASDLSVGLTSALDHGGRFCDACDTPNTCAVTADIQIGSSVAELKNLKAARSIGPAGQCLSRPLLLSSS
jgi:hypothetical protein